MTICADNFYVQGHIFCHTISRNINFRTVAAIENRRKATLERELKDVFHLYSSRGFEVVDMHADNEFAPLQANIRPVIANIVAADDHVGQVERSIRTIKERVRATVHGLPFRRYPVLMVRELVTLSVRTLNQLPNRKGILPTMSPRKIITGLPDPDYNSMRIEFGQYAQVFEERRQTSTTAPRTIGAIALNPTGNAQGSYYFLSLTTGARISRQQWTELPITQDVINRVEELAEQQEQPIINGELVFEWAPNVPIEDHDDDIANEDDLEEEDGAEEGANNDAHHNANDEGAGEESDDTDEHDIDEGAPDSSDSERHVVSTSDDNSETTQRMTPSMMSMRTKR